MNDFTYIHLARDIRDYEDKTICTSWLVVKSPKKIPAATAHLPQEDVWQWCIENYPGWMPMAYLTQGYENVSD